MPTGRAATPVPPPRARPTTLAQEGSSRKETFTFLVLISDSHITESASERQSVFTGRATGRRETAHMGSPPRYWPQKRPERRLTPELHLGFEVQIFSRSPSLLGPWAVRLGRRCNWVARVGSAMGMAGRGAAGGGSEPGEEGGGQHSLMVRDPQHLQRRDHSLQAYSDPGLTLGHEVLFCATSHLHRLALWSPGTVPSPAPTTAPGGPALVPTGPWLPEPIPGPRSHFLASVGRTQ